VFSRPQPSDLHQLGAREAVERIRDGSLKTEAYVARLIEQSRAYGDLNAINWISEARVLEAARAVDQSRARGDRLPALAGLPVAIKDQILVAGYPSTGGNGALKGHIPRRNAAVVDTLVQAGAIPFCMAACPDMTVIDGLMHQVFSHSPSFGAVRNAYDRTRGPGGSSGGNGALLAARIVPAALGEDTNGSIRLPSAWSGTAGLRPSTFTLENALQGTSRKRYSDDGLMLPPSGRLDTIGPMARTVADVAFLDAAITGEVAPQVDPRSIRIAIPSPEYWEWESVDEGVAKVMQEAFVKLREAGCQLVELDFNRDVRAIVGTIDNQAPVTIIGALGLNAPPIYSDENMAKWLRENAPDVTVDQMYGSRPKRGLQFQPPKLPPVEEQRRIISEGARRYAEVFRSRNVTAIAFPTVPIPAIPLHPGGPKEPLGETYTNRGRQLVQGKVILENLFVAPRMGAAGLSLPAGMTNGLPVGLELDALPGNDRMLLGIGVAIEKILGPIPPPRLNQ
jgi:mandelamide amidase